MKFTLFEVDSKRPLWGSVTVVGYLSYFVLIIGLLSGCSTRVDTENATGTSPQVLPTGTSQVPLPPNLFGGDYSPPVTPTNQYYPPSSGPIYVPPTAMTCYLQRSGGYYYVGYGVRWDFTSDTGEPLEVTRIDSGEYWSSPPQYPLPASFAITFYTAGNRQLSFTVRSRNNPSSYCNGGQAIYDSVYVNQPQYY